MKLRSIKHYLRRLRNIIGTTRKIANIRLTIDAVEITIAYAMSTLRSGWIHTSRAHTKILASRKTPTEKQRIFMSVFILILIIDLYNYPTAYTTLLSY